MDFSKLQKEVAALLEAPAKVETAVETTVDTSVKEMTAEDFAAYAKEQVDTAKAEHEAGKVDLAKERLTALQAQVDAVAKFEYKPGELPKVTIFRVPEQRTTTEETTQPKHQDLGGPGMGFTAKADSLSALVKETAASLEKPTPASEAAPQTPATKEVVEDTWPSDLAKDATDELSFGRDRK